MLDEPGRLPLSDRVYLSRIWNQKLPLHGRRRHSLKFPIAQFLLPCLHSFRPVYPTGGCSGLTAHHGHSPQRGRRLLPFQLPRQPYESWCSILRKICRRHTIDDLLTSAGWLLQDKNGFNLNAAEGIAIREFSLRSGECDYLQVDF
jgi:hypothetical protein